MEIVLILSLGLNASLGLAYMSLRRQNRKLVSANLDYLATSADPEIRHWVEIARRRMR